MAIPKEKLLEMYRNLLTARRWNEKHYELQSRGVGGMLTLHSWMGEEAPPIAVIANLRKDDYYHGNYRERDAIFAKGMPLRDVIASEFSRDVSKVGWHSNHIDLDYGALGWTGALGEDAAIYVGGALAAVIMKTDRVSVFICGDGTANRGPVHESMVLATAWNLPMVFAIQNNQYGMGTSVHDSYKIKDLSDRAKAYGFPGQTVDGNDVIASYEVAKEYIHRARSGGGPGLIVFETYRLTGHYEGDPQIYRPKGEVEEWWKKDPLPRYQKRLMEMGILTKEDVSKLEVKIKAEIEEATEAALALPLTSYEDHVKYAIDEI